MCQLKDRGNSNLMEVSNNYLVHLQQPYTGGSEIRSEPHLNNKTSNFEIKKTVYGFKAVR